MEPRRGWGAVNFYFLETAPGLYAATTLKIISFVSDLHYMLNEIPSKTSRNFQSSRRMNRQYCVRDVIKPGSVLTREAATFIHPG